MYVVITKSSSIVFVTSSDTFEDLLKIIPNTRMHSSGMRTARLLLYPSKRCDQGVYLPKGCTCQGGTCLGGPARGVYLLGGVPARGYLPRGIPMREGVPAWGVPAQVLLPL